VSLIKKVIFLFSLSTRIPTRGARCRKRHKGEEQATATRVVEAQHGGPRAPPAPAAAGVPPGAWAPPPAAAAVQ